jgi:acyl-CoA synthetase (AMP-forming)/AMP-acid ligase II
MMQTGTLEGVVRGPTLVRSYQGVTYAEALEATAVALPNAYQTFWSDGELTRTTFADLRNKGHQLARALHALGIRRGDTIAIQMPNRVETAIAYRACFSLGACLTPITHIYGPAEVTYILQNCRARLLVVPDRWRSIDFVERVASLGVCPDLRHVVFVGESGLEGSLRWDALMAGSHDAFEPPILGEDDPVLLLYTSGTTAAPKGVIHTSRTLLSEIDQRSMAGESISDTTFSCWPAGHIGGFSSLINPQIVGGGSILMDRWSAEDGVRLMADFGVSRTAGVPVFLIELLDTARRLKTELPQLTSYMTGGANVPPDIVEEAERAGIAVFRCYGSSEHPTVTGSLPTAPLQERAHTDGTVLPGSEVRLLDENGRDVAETGEGEIVTRGAELFQGYFDPELNRDAFLEDGWFRTGDIGRIDDGKLIITDRKKDIIIRGGENISSKEVEDVLASHPAVMEAAAFATPHPRLGEGVAIAVRLHQGASLTINEVGRHFARAGIARQKVPEKLVIVDDMPRTGSGKVKKYELRQRFADPI